MLWKTVLQNILYNTCCCVYRPAFPPTVDGASRPVEVTSARVKVRPYVAKPSTNLCAGAPKDNHVDTEDSCNMDY